MSVVAVLAVSGCVLVLRPPITDTFGFRPKPLERGRDTPAQWGWSAATLDTIARTDSAGGLLAWWGPATAGTVPCAGVLLLHGKGDNRAQMLPLGQALQAAGFSVLIPDYRGYGGTSGVPSTPGIFDDAALAYRNLRARVRDTLTPTIVIGHSMGTALAARLARERNPLITVYMSPFTRISALVRSRAGAIGTRLFDTTAFAFNPIEDAALARTRALIVIAGRDELIRKSVSEAFVAGMPPGTPVLRDETARHDGVLSSAATVRAIADSLQAWTRCAGRGGF
jgi:pimeloyl-ACP methyl ester carboxylesterase